MAGLAGLALAASFPQFNLAGLAWVAPGGLLFVALGRTGGQAFRLGYLGGLAHYLASLHWLLFIPYPSGAVMGWLALSAYLALWPAFWVWACWCWFPAFASPSASWRAGAPGAEVSSPSDATDSPPLPAAASWLAGAQRFASLGVMSRLAWGVSCGVAWVAMEMLVGRLLSGFPWNFLGVSQHRMLPLIQIASITGVYGVSFLVVWTSVGLVGAAVVLAARPHGRWGWLVEGCAPLLAVVLVALLGVRTLALAPAATGHGGAASRELKIALVQPSIPQTLIWDPAQNTNRFEKLLQLSELALAAKPDLLVWPEAAVPNLFRYSEHVYTAATGLARTHRVWMILGADDAEPRATRGGAEDFDYFNSSFLLNPSGEIAATYRKRRLVIFGEYVPLQRWLPFLRHLTPIEGGFTAGRHAVAFRLSELAAEASPLICFEDVFPHGVREAVTAHTDFLVNLTNDAWFGQSAAQWQHAVNALFRAIETGLPLIRCTNNGVTCWIDPRGRWREVFATETRGVYGEGFQIVRVPLPPLDQRPQPTFYREHGDWFGWGCVLGSALIGLFAALARRQRCRSSRQG
jgi:apolipoprotein N-acyltransferase